MPDEFITEWLKSLQSTDRDERAEACIQLADRDARGALAELRWLTRDDDMIVALAAAYACWKLGGDPLPADLLIDALESGDETNVQQAVHTASAVGSDLVPVLEPLLDSSRDRALLVLELLDDMGGRDAKQAIRRMTSTDEVVRERAREILDEWENDQDDEA